MCKDLISQNNCHCEDDCKNCQCEGNCEECPCEDDCKNCPCEGNCEECPCDVDCEDCPCASNCEDNCGQSNTDQELLGFIQKVLQAADNEQDVINLFGPWHPTFDAQRKLISAELEKSGVRTIRLSEHADLYTLVELSPAEIEKQKQIAAEEYAKELQKWNNPPIAILTISIAPMPESPHTPDSPVQ